MSVLIKGMDMPKSCDECPYAEYYGEKYNRKCQILGGYVDIIDDNGKTVRDDNCPFIEIPTPHGRLIDADKLLSVIERNSYRLKNFYNSCDEGMFLLGIKQAIGEAPTIIEAEE